MSFQTTIIYPNIASYKNQNKTKKRINHKTREEKEI